MVRSRPKPGLESVVAYLVYACSAEDLGVTKLMKLLYLGQLYHYQATGHPLVNCTFRHYERGPFASDVYAALQSLQAKGLIREEPTQYFEYLLHRVRPVRPDTFVRLSKAKLRTLAREVEDWRQRPLPHILEFVYSTRPFFGTKFNEEIDCSDVPRVALETSVALRRLALAPKLPRGHRTDAKALDTLHKDLAATAPMRARANRLLLEST